MQDIAGRSLLGDAVRALDRIRQHHPRSELANRCRLGCAILGEMSIRSSVVRGSTATAASRAASPANSRSASPAYSLDYRSVRPPKLERGHGGRWPGHAGRSVIKHSARKIRRLYQDKILAGFAGSTADAFSLFSRFEAKLEQYAGNLGRSAVELAKDWRTDKMLRNLEALLVVADLQQTFLISGSGDVIEPDEGIAAIGSGGSFALAAARALVENSDLPARAIAEKSLRIAGQICIYTNDQITIEELHG